MMVAKPAIKDVIEGRSVTSQKFKFIKIIMGFISIIRKKKMRKTPLPKISLLVQIGG